jgi:uncharacterized iron-regulated membrane protein
MTRTRQFFVIAHRWAGLYLALWLAIVGLTGTVLAFYPELEKAFAAPHAFNVPASEKPLTVEQLTVKAQILAQPGSLIAYAPLTVERGKPYSVYIAPPITKAGEETEGKDILLNPFTGEQVAETGAEPTGITVLNTIYDLHYTLLLGEIGSTILGISALIWTIDCFVGMYLTFPVQRKVAGTSGSGWLTRWKPAWLVRRKTNGYKFSFDLHRAGGLWVWAMLLVFAWSSVAFNLRQVYTPVMKAFGYQDFYATEAEQPPLNTPKIGWQQALTIARADAVNFGAQNGFSTRKEYGLNYDPAAGRYAYGFETTADRADVHSSSVFIDGRTGAVTARETAVNRPTANAVTNWIMSLHMARWGGLAFKIFVSIMGLLITALCVTGVIIWMRKRKARFARGRLSVKNPAIQSYAAVPAE